MGVYRQNRQIYIRTNEVDISVEEENMKCLILCCILLVIFGCSTAATTVHHDTQPRVLDAKFTIEHWLQNEHQGHWVVHVFFEMRNTGNVQIAYYEVYFRIVCEDGSEYRGEGWGPYESIEKAHQGITGKPVYPGGTCRGMGGHSDCKSKPVSVEVVDWKLYQYR